MNPVTTSVISSPCAVHFVLKARWTSGGRLIVNRLFGTTGACDFVSLFFLGLATGSLLFGSFSGLGAVAGFSFFFLHSSLGASVLFYTGQNSRPALGW